MQTSPVTVVGGGPAGLTAAYALVRDGVAPLVLEKTGQVGGLSRTVEHNGYRFDIGGHRFFTKVAEVEALWHEVLGDAFVRVPRLSRIYYGGKFYPYPLDLRTTLVNLGPVESVRIALSYLKARLRPRGDEENFEQWVSNRFGERLYRMFFKTYTEKVWGLPCTQIRADWAAQRIKGLSLRKAVQQALFDRSDETSLIDAFWYPTLGPGMMWERFAERVVEGGGTVRLHTEAVALEHEAGRVRRVVVASPEGTAAQPTDHVINSMPLPHLIARLRPAPPEPVQEAARGLAYRDFVVVALVLDRPEVFPDNWIYVHSPDVRVGRIQNFKNWSAALVADPATTCLGLEYFCTRDDDLWARSDEALVDLARRELETIGLSGGARVLDAAVVRQPMAYPVYDENYRAHLAVLQDYLAGFANLQTVGRAGMHRYNNQDHSMLTALLAVRNYFGESHDLWSVNVERSYLESFTVAEQAAHDEASALEQAA